MNELIFMMWLADVVSVSTGMGMLSALFFFCFFAAKSFQWVDSDFPKISSWLICVPVFMALTAWLMPSKQTIYAAVALKAGAEIVESRVGQKAVGAIEAILDEVIAKKDKK